jgi:hypothetical protein
MTNLGHPEPPHETNLGKDSVPADAVAEVQEEAIVAEEFATDE